MFSTLKTLMNPWTAKSENCPKHENEDWALWIALLHWLWNCPMTVQKHLCWRNWNVLLGHLPNCISVRWALRMHAMSSDKHISHQMKPGLQEEEPLWCWMNNKLGRMATHIRQGHTGVSLAGKTICWFISLGLHHRTVCQVSDVSSWLVIYLVGTLSPVNHKGIYQGWKHTSVYLLVSHSTSHFRDSTTCCTWRPT